MFTLAIKTPQGYTANCWKLVRYEETANTIQAAYALYANELHRSEGAEPIYVRSFILPVETVTQADVTAECDAAVKAIIEAEL